MQSMHLTTQNAYKESTHFQKKNARNCFGVEVRCRIEGKSEHFRNLEVTSSGEGFNVRQNRALLQCHMQEQHTDTAHQEPLTPSEKICCKEANRILSLIAIPALNLMVVRHAMEPYLATELLPINASASGHHRQL